MFVGGEFYTEQAWLGNPSTHLTPDHNRYFLNGGRACLTVISDFLLDHGMNKVLLPAYLCPSIVQTFERSGVGWEFYQVNQDLSIDLDDLARKLPGFQAVYFINYFGFTHNAQTQNLFKSLQQNKIIVIEDNAQAGFPDHPTGDFIFNSLRKLAAYDGGYLITRHAMQPYLERYAGLPNRRLPLIRAYRQNLAHYLFDQTGSYDQLVDLFQRATHYYETEQVILGDAGEYEQIERLDWPAIRQIRRDNFRYLMNWVASIPEITPIFGELQDDTMPFGLPVYFPLGGGVRDRVNAELGKAGIGLTIHWEDICSDPRTRQNHQAVDMAGRMLTLVIDQRIRHKQLDYLALNLIAAITAVNR
jgi:hypothetical protein